MTAGTACSTGAKADDLFSNAELDTRVLIPTCQGGIYLSITKQQTKGAEVSANSKFLLGRSCHLHHLREMSEDLTWEGDSAAVTLTKVTCNHADKPGNHPWWLKFAKSQVMAAMGCVELLHILPFDSFEVFIQ